MSFNKMYLNIKSDSFSRAKKFTIIKNMIENYSYATKSSFNKIIRNIEYDLNIDFEKILEEDTII